MEAPTWMPSQCALALRSWPIKKQVSVGVNKAHARVDPQHWYHLVGHPDPLKNPHGFVVEMHRTWQVIGCRLAVENQCPDASQAEQMRQGGADGAKAYDHYVEDFIFRVLKHL